MVLSIINHGEAYVELGMSCSLSHVRCEMFNPVSMPDGPRANGGRRGHSCLRACRGAEPGGAHLPPAPGPLSRDLAKAWAIPGFSRCKPRRVAGSESPQNRNFSPWPLPAAEIIQMATAARVRGVGVPLRGHRGAGA